MPRSAISSGWSQPRSLWSIAWPSGGRSRRQVAADCETAPKQDPRGDSPKFLILDHVSILCPRATLDSRLFRATYRQWASVPAGRPLGKPGADAPAERDRDDGGGDRGDPEYF